MRYMIANDIKIKDQATDKTAVKKEVKPTEITEKKEVEVKPPVVASK